MCHATHFKKSKVKHLTLFKTKSFSQHLKDIQGVKTPSGQMFQV